MTSKEARAGSRIYTKSTLSIYDIYVLRFSGRFAWKCPAPLILDFYNRYVSSNHLDVGVGTGYFLDKCRFPSETPTIALVDLNPNSLQVAAKRLSRYSPMVYEANALEPLQIGTAGFDSAGVTYLLHCLPGSMLSKGIVFRNLKPLLNKDGVVFGTTILGQGVKHNFLARTLMKLYNSQGFFSNWDDSLTDLESILKENFSDYSVQVVGCMALFVGLV